MAPGGVGQAAQPGSWHQACLLPARGLLPQTGPQTRSPCSCEAALGAAGGHLCRVVPGGCSCGLATCGALQWGTSQMALCFLGLPGCLGSHSRDSDLWEQVEVGAWPLGPPGGSHTPCPESPYHFQGSGDTSRAPLWCSLRLLSLPGLSPARQTPLVPSSHQPRCALPEGWGRPAGLLSAHLTQWRHPRVALPLLSLPSLWPWGSAHPPPSCHQGLRPRAGVQGGELSGHGCVRGQRWGGRGGQSAAWP